MHAEGRRGRAGRGTTIAGMKKILEGAGLIMLVLGGCGVIRELTGWFRFMAFTRFLTENVSFLGDAALLTNIVIAVVGFAVMMMADNLK